MGVHDSERHRQAESRSLARRLCCEERLKDAGLNRPGDAGAVVFDEELDEAVVLLGCRDFDRPVTTGLHGLLRIEEEIHQDLLDLVRAALDVRQVRWNHGFKGDLVQAQFVMEDRPCVGDHVLERDRFGRQVFLPCEL